MKRMTQFTAWILAIILTAGSLLVPVSATMTYGDAEQAEIMVSAENDDIEEKAGEEVLEEESASLQRAEMTGEATDPAKGEAAPEEVAADSVEEVSSLEEEIADLIEEGAASEETAADSAEEETVPEEAAADPIEEGAASEEAAADLAEEETAPEEAAADFAEEETAPEEAAADPIEEGAVSEEAAADPTEKEMAPEDVSDNTEDISISEDDSAAIEEKDGLESEEESSVLEENGESPATLSGQESESDQEIEQAEEDLYFEESMDAGGSNPYPTSQDVDGDGNYEIPCTRFAWQQAYDNHGISLPGWGNAANWFQGAKNSGYSTGSVAQPGSIAVWSGDYYGHVAYVTSASGTTFTVNEGGRTDLDHTSSHGIAYGYTLTNATGASRPYDTGKTLLGFIYLNGTPSPPVNPTLSVNKNRFLASDTITINAHADGATNYYGAIYKNKTRIWEGECLQGGVIQYPASQFGSGEFSAYVTCSNNYGWVDSPWVSYTVPENMGDSFYAFIILNKDWKHLGLTGRNVQIPSANDCFDPRQIWRFEKQSDGSYIAYSMYMSGYDNSEWVLTCRNGGKTNGTNIEVEKLGWLTSQKWLIYVYNNEYKLVPMHCSLAMDAAGGSSAPGTNIQLYESNDTCWQRFIVYKLSYDNATYTRPGKPSASSYTGVTESDAGQAVNLTWTESPKVNNFDKRSYRLQVFDGENREVYSQGGLTGTNYSYSFGQPGTYYIQITAVNDNLMGVETAGSKTKITIHNNLPLTVTKSPASVTVEEGEIVRMSSTATGYGLNYQWYILKKGSTTWEKADFQGSQSAIIVITADSSVDGAQFKCVFTDQYNDTAESDAATITISKLDFPEEKIQITAEDVALSRTSCVYTGTARRPGVTVTIDEEVLVAKTDYTVSYKNNLNVGTATVTVTGIGDYEGTVKKTFKIKAASIDDAEITGLKTKTYTGKALKQYPEVTINDVVLEKDADYTVSFKNNKNAGTATVTITGTGNYEGTATGTFKIKAASIAGAEVTGIKTKTYNGKALKQSPEVELGGTVLEAGKDYSVSYKNNTKAGTATVMITGTGNYTGTVSEDFTIKPAPITNAAVTCPAAKVFEGWALTPVPTVKIGSTTLKKGTDFALSYKNNKNVGTATVTIKGKGNYAGTINRNFKINPKPTTITKLAAATGKLTVTWKKQASQTTGYQIQYSSRSDFKTQKTVKITSNSATSKALTGLAKKKKYYVRIRTYKQIGSAMYYSSWSGVKTATTK